jgi:hypothetical protein
MPTFAGYPHDVIISMNYYDQDGQACVDLFDNPLLGWLVGDDGNSTPVVTGSLPPTGEGPQWAHIHDNSIYVPDMWRGTVMDFFTWLATSTGTTRKLRGNFRHPSMAAAMNNFSHNRPDLFNDKPF